MADSFKIAFGCAEKTFSDYPVSRRVVRVGGESASDIVLSGTSMSSNVLTLNFATDGIIAAYARSKDVIAIAGSPPELNKGIEIQVGDTIEIANGWWLRVLVADTAAVSNGESTVGAVNPSRVEPHRTNTAGQIITRRVEQDNVQNQSSGIAFPLIVLICVLIALFIVAVALKRLNSEPSQVTLTHLLTQMMDVEESNGVEPTIEQIRHEILLGYKHKQSDDMWKKHFSAARVMLEARLGNEIISTEISTTKLEESFNRKSEIQLYRAISDMLR